MNEQSISLDLKKNPVPVPVLYLGQGDLNGTTLNVAVTDNGDNFDLSGYDVKLCIRQPLHAGYYECDGTSASNVATFVIDETYGATTPGVSDCAYVDVIDDGNVIASTARFQVVVLPNASEGVNPTTAYTNGIVEFLEESEAEFDEKIAEVDAAIEAIGEISVLAVPLMSTTTRGGAMVGAGLEVDGNGKLKIGTSINLFPFFSEYRPLSSTSNWWYWSNLAATFTPLTEGWVRFSRTVSSSSTAQWVAVAQDFVKASGEYTLMVEVRNVTVTGGNASIRPSRNNNTAQFVQGDTNINLADGAGVYYLPLTAKSDITGKTTMLYSDVSQDANTTVLFDMRISLYTGTYDGVYQPYIWPNYGITPNLFSLTDATEDSTLNSSGAESTPTTAAGHTSSVSDYIPVEPGKYYSLSVDMDDSQASIAFDRCCSYDSSKNFVAVISYHSEGANAHVRGNYLVPSGVAYVRLSARGLTETTTYPTRLGSVMFTEGRRCMPWAPSPKDFFAAMDAAEA